MKDKTKIILKIFAHILVILLTYKFENYFYRDYSFSTDRIFILQVVNQVILTSLIYNPKKFWDFVYKKRYQMALIIFLFLVINGYHGSSIGLYNDAIEPNSNVESSEPFFGTLRPIRSDEYMVDSMLVFSNVTSNDLKTINNNIMADRIITNFYPHLPTKDVGVLTRINFLGYLFLPVSMAFSFSWYLPFFISFMGLFELLMLVTKKKKIFSLLGTVLICCSPCLLWWNSYLYLMSGVLAIHCFRFVIVSDSKKKKIFFTILLALCGVNYIMIMYPAWQLCYGYVYLAFIIWILYDNRDKLKWSYLWYLLLCIFIILSICIPIVYNSLEQLNRTMSTVYPGARFIEGGSEWKLNFMYMPSLFYTVADIGNPCEFSQTLSLYPLPMIIGFVIAIKNFRKKKNDVLLNSLLAVALIFTIFNYFKVPLLPRITLLYMVPCERLTVITGILNVLLLIIIVSNYAKSHTTSKDAILSSILAIIFTIFSITVCYSYIKEKNLGNYYEVKFILISVIIFFILNLLFVLNDKKYNKYFAVLFILTNLIIGVGIFPMSKGIDVVTDKPLAKEIHNLVKNDNDSTWIVTNTDVRLSNYLVANGAKVYNSVNFFKNDDFWKIVDKEGKHDEVYNRYAHIMFGIKNGQTEYELIQSDLFIAHLDSTKICELDIKYILSGVDISKEKYDGLKMNSVYENDGVFIYKTICS